MSGTTIIARRRPDGVLVQILEDGSERPFPPPPPMREMTDEEVEAAALSDPDAQPLTEADFARMRKKRTPRVKTMCRALRLTLEEYAARYLIPLSTLQDWEQRRSEPDPTLDSYLSVIAAAPEFVQHVLHPEEEVLPSYRVHPKVSYRSGLPLEAILRLHPDGTLVQVLDSGDERRLPDRLPKRSPIQEKTNKTALPHANGYYQIEKERKNAQDLQDVKQLRCSLGLTQEEFSSFYSIHPDTLQDWEEGVVSPGPGERAFLLIIAVAPNFVHRVLHNETPTEDFAESPLARQNGAHPDEPSAEKGQPRISQPNILAPV